MYEPSLLFGLAVCQKEHLLFQYIIRKAFLYNQLFFILKRDCFEKTRFYSTKLKLDTCSKQIRKNAFFGS